MTTIKKHLKDYIKTKLLGLQTHKHMNWKNHTIKHLSAPQAWKDTCWHPHIVHITMKTSQPWRIIRVILNQQEDYWNTLCFYYTEKFLMLKNDSSNYKLHIMNCLQLMNFAGKILINFILYILYFCYIRDSFYILLSLWLNFEYAQCMACACACVNVFTCVCVCVYI